MLGSACFAVGPECACREAPRWLWGVGTLNGSRAHRDFLHECRRETPSVLSELAEEALEWLLSSIPEILCTVSHGRALGFDPGPAALQLTGMKEDPLRKMPDPHPPPAAVPS